MPFMMFPGSTANRASCRVVKRERAGDTTKKPCDLDTQGGRWSNHAVGISGGVFDRFRYRQVRETGEGGSNEFPEEAAVD